MNKAVLVIDVQTILFQPEPKPYQALEVVDRINTITGWARQQRYPVIFIQHEQPGTPIEFDSEGWQLHENLNVVQGDLFVRKATPDSFLETNLSEVLTQLGTQHLVICGYSTEFCVDTTTRRAVGLGYSVELVSDAHTSHDKPHATGEQIRTHHNATLPHIIGYGGGVMAIPTAHLVGQA